MGFGGIAAPDDLRLRVADVIETVGHRAVAPGIGDARDRGRMTDTRLVIGVVCAPEGAQFAEQIGPLIGEFRRAQPIDRIGARLRADRLQLVADLVDRLTPTHPGPLAVDELQRVFEPPLAGDEFAHGCSLRTMRAAVDRAVPAWLLADPYTIGHLGRDGATHCAMRADTLAHFDLCAGWGWRPSVGRPHTGER